MVMDIYILLTLLTGQLPTIQFLGRAERGSEATLDRLLRLDSWVNPGIPAADFKKLFAMCHCGMITTRRVFDHHVCVSVIPVIIDLTGDVPEENGPVIIDLTGDSDDE